MGVEVQFDETNHYIQVKGELTNDTVMQALAEFARHCKALPRWVIDLTHVNRMDSSALALMIELRRNARRKNKEISFIYIPQPLLRMARLSQMEHLLQEKPR